MPLPRWENKHIIISDLIRNFQVVFIQYNHLRRIRNCNLDEISAMDTSTISPLRSIAKGLVTVTVTGCCCEQEHNEHAAATAKKIFFILSIINERRMGLCQNMDNAVLTHPPSVPENNPFRALYYLGCLPI